MSSAPAPDAEPAPLRVGSDIPFYVCFGVIGGAYILLIAGMLLAEVGYTTPGDIISTLADPKVQYSIRLSLISCTITTILALWVSVPIGYLLSRHNFRGKAVVDAPGTSVGAGYVRQDNGIIIVLRTQFLEHFQPYINISEGDIPWPKQG